MLVDICNRSYCSGEKGGLKGFWNEFCHLCPATATYCGCMLGCLEHTYREAHCAKIRNLDKIIHDMVNIDNQSQNLETCNCYYAWVHD